MGKYVCNVDLLNCASWWEWELKKKIANWIEFEGIGLLLRWQKPAIADRFTRFLRFITIFFILYILTFGIYTNLYVFKLINFRTLIVSAILPYTGFLIGFLLSLITRQNKERLIAIFIESGTSLYLAYS